MELSLKTKVIGSVVVVLTAFAFGRYSAPIMPNSKTDTKIDINKETQTDTHKTTVITEDPKGNKTTTITEDTKTDTKKNSEKTVDTTITAPNKSVINISGLASLDTGHGFIPVYGISAQKQLIGPITVGAFGLTNGVIGVSVGLNF